MIGGEIMIGDERNIILIQDLQYCWLSFFQDKIVMTIVFWRVGVERDWAIISSWSFCETGGFASLGDFNQIFLIFKIQIELK